MPRRSEEMNGHSLIMVSVVSKLGRLPGQKSCRISVINEMVPLKKYVRRHQTGGTFVLGKLCITAFTCFSPEMSRSIYI
jgi:hypothetical protein